MSLATSPFNMRNCHPSTKKQLIHVCSWRLLVKAVPDIKLLRDCLLVLSAAMSNARLVCRP